jgi:signal peptidase II
MRLLGQGAGDARRRRTLLVALATVTVIADAATKRLASATLDRPVHVVGPLDLRLVHNPGVAFGLGSGAPTAFILIGTLVTVLALGIGAWRNRLGSVVGAGLVLGGAVGNLADRLTDGTVVDMFDVGWWPTFNAADVFITVGVAVLLWTEQRGATPPVGTGSHPEGRPSGPS